VNAIVQLDGAYLGLCSSRLAGSKSIRSGNGRRYNCAVLPTANAGQHATSIIVSRCCSGFLVSGGI